MNVLVFGPAKTGTTAVSKSIHQALPGSEYKLEPKTTQFFMRPAGPTGIVVKIIYEHWNERRHLRNAIIHNELALTFDRVVATVRDPRDEMVSRMYFVARASATARRVPDAKIDEWIELLRAKEADPASTSFLRICDEAKRLLGTELRPDPSIFARYHRFVTGTPKRVHVVRYEDYVDGKLEALSAHLGVQVKPEPDLGVHAYTRRSGAYGEWRRIFTDEDVAFFRPSLAPVLDELGYTDWSLVREPILDPSTRSAYVRRLVDEVRDEQASALARDVRGPTYTERLLGERPGLERLIEVEDHLVGLARRANRLRKRARKFVRSKLGR